MFSQKLMRDVVLIAFFIICLYFTYNKGVSDTLIGTREANKQREIWRNNAMRLINENKKLKNQIEYETKNRKNIPTR